MAQIAPEPLDWLIPGLVPRGELTLLAGPSECGKSTFLARLVAHVTTGGRWDSRSEHPPSHALIYPLEEAAGAAPLERLVAAEADLSRVAVGTRLPDGRAAELPYLPDRIAALRQRLRDTRASFCYIDPLSSMLGSGISVNDGQHVRAVLVPLQQLARELSITILFTLNYRKNTQGDASNWVSGHKDWWNVPRHILCMGRDPTYPDRGVLAVGKQGRGRKRRSMAYRIVQRDGADWWESIGDTDTSAHDLGCDLDDDLGRSARQLARDYLRQVLAEEDQKASRLLLECQQAGFGVRTLERAAADLGVKKEFRVSAGDRAWYWVAPAKWPD